MTVKLRIGMWLGLMALVVAQASCSPFYRMMGYPPEVTREEAPPEIVKSALPVGASLPMDVSLTDDTGKPVDFAAVKAKGGLVLLAYRGDWCPYCRAQLLELQQNVERFRSEGAEIVAVSVDDAETSAGLRKRLSLTFPLWSDPDRKFVNAMGIRDTGNDIAWPAVYIVDGSGVVRWRWLAEVYMKRPSAVDVLGHVRQVLAKPESKP